MSGRWKETSPSIGRWGDGFSMLLERIHCSALRSSLNSFPKSLNMSHNHLVMPERKSDSPLLPVPTICPGPVPPHTPCRAVLGVQIGWDFPRSGPCAEGRRFKGSDVLELRWEAVCSPIALVFPNAFVAPLGGEIKGWSGRKQTHVKFFWKLRGKGLALAHYTCLPSFGFSLTSPSREHMRFPWGVSFGICTTGSPLPSPALHGVLLS